MMGEICGMIDEIEIIALGMACLARVFEIRASGEIMPETIKGAVKPQKYIK